MNNNSDTKCFFLQFLPLRFEQGITRKIVAQVKALKNQGFETYLSRMVIEDGERSFFIDDHKVIDLGKGMIGSINYLCRYTAFLRFVEKNNIKFVYIRYILTANPFFIKFLRNLKKKGVTIFMEIPTYPYEKEFSNKPKHRLISFIEKYSRKDFYKYVDRITTYSSDSEIFGVKTINLSNSVDLGTIPLRQPEKHQGFNILAVAVLCFWHGYDRLIASVGEYYKKGGKENINVYIIGGGEDYIKEYQKIANNYNICEHIHLEGPKKSEELDYYFNISDIAIGSLGRHRSGISDLKTLKNVEYAARGIPFVYSENNSDFDSMPYILKVSPDESIFDLNLVIDFAKRTTLSAKEIRKTVDPIYTWDFQMKKVSDAYRSLV